MPGRNKIAAGLLGVTAFVMGVVDASVMNEEALARTAVVAGEHVEARQFGNVVEAKFPWKGNQGITVRYDLGEPTALERLADKRNRQVVTEAVDYGDGGFKVDLLLNERPTTNQFCFEIETDGSYEFFYQPFDDTTRLDGEPVRPENIQGSYAVYSGGRKVMHILRPEVWELDAPTSTRQWAELSYEDSNLCVTVDQSYLATANYPVRVDPTFGYTSIGATSDIVVSNKMTGSLFTLPEDGAVSSISMYMSSVTANTYTVAVYDDNTSSPNNLLFSTTSSLSASDGWKEFTLSPAYDLSAGDYWLMVNNGFFNYDIHWDSGATDQGCNATDSPPPADPAATCSDSTGVQNRDNKFSVYANYSATETAFTYPTTSLAIFDGSAKFDGATYFDASPDIYTAEFDPLSIGSNRVWFDFTDSSTVSVVTGISEVTDKSGNGYDALQASGTAQPGYVTGEYALFNSISHQLEVNVGSQSSAYPFTVAAWVYVVASTGGAQIIWYEGNNDPGSWFAHYASINGTAATMAGTAVYNNSFNSASAAITTGTWYFLTVLYKSNSEREIWINGSFVSENTSSILSPFSLFDWVLLGNGKTGQAFTPNFRIREFYIYDKILTSDEINDLMTYKDPI